MMNTNVTQSGAQTAETRIAGAAPRGGYKPALLIAAAILAIAVPVSAQSPADLQQKVAALKQSVAENQQKLHHYQWLETTQTALKGDAKPATQAVCQYGPDGKVQKSSISAPPPPPNGRRVKQAVVAKKKGEIKDYMEQVKSLLGMYVPPDAQRIQQAVQAGKVSLNPNPSSGLTQIVLKDYAQAGDQMTVSFDSATMKITVVSVNTWMDDPKDAVSLTLQFASLPDSTNYVQQTVLNATAKKIVVTTTNSDYKALGGQ